MRTPVLYSDRIKLRPLQVEDAIEIYSRWATDPDVTKYMRWETHKSVEVTIEWLSENVKHISNKNVFDWAFIDRETGMIIGSGGIYYDHKMGMYELGYCLAKDFWGRGLATEAGRRIIEFAIDELGARRLVAKYAIDNSSSGHVLKKLGFTHLRYSEYSSFDGSKTFASEELLLVKPDKTFTVAMLQMVSEPTLEMNLNKGVMLCRRAKVMGADLALFPEMWNNGYNSDSSTWNDEAIDTESEFVYTFVKLAEELDMAIAITYLQKYNPKPRNVVTVIDRFGVIQYTYAKVHTCDFDIENNLTSGDDFFITDLDTSKGIVKLGAMICYDREFPESARLLMLKGAEIIIVPNACPMEINRISQLRGRSYENMLGIATCNYAIGQPDCNGHSNAFDGMAYDLDGQGGSYHRDSLVVEAGEEEGVVLASFLMDRIRNYRKREVHGDQFRKIDVYKRLID